jgi:hypothetical protein
MTSPATAVNTASNITRGFISKRLCVSNCSRERKSATKLVGLYVFDHGRVTVVARVATSLHDGLNRFP